MITRSGFIFRYSSEYFAQPLLGVLSRSPIGDAVRRRKKASGKRGYDAMAPETRARLVEHFRPLNDRLAAATGRDLPRCS